MTIYELEKKMKFLDELSILELLNINSDDLVDRFCDRIEDKQDVLEEMFYTEEKGMGYYES